MGTTADILESHIARRVQHSTKHLSHHIHGCDIVLPQVHVGMAQAWSPVVDGRRASREHFIQARRISTFQGVQGLLIAAGREFQGEYDLYLNFGIPNEEVSRGGISDVARRALMPLFNTAYTIRRTDEQERVTTWVLRLVELNPYPQTFGSFAAWYYTVDGIPVETDITKHLTLDIGGGQFHQCEVTLQHQTQGMTKLRMATSLLDEGTIGIARAVREQLRAQYPGLRLSDAEAQQVLVSRHALIEGRRTPINDVVSEVIAARSQNLLTHLRHQLQDKRSFLMFTGGGSILLAPSLQELVRAHRRTQSFLFVPKDLASVLNAVGGYILAQATAQKVIARMQEKTTPERETR